MKINNFVSYYRIYNEQQQTFYPENILDLRNSIKSLVKKKKKILIRSGFCG